MNTKFYPLFHEYSKIAHNTYWKKVFYQLSFGHYFDIHIDNNFLYSEQSDAKLKLDFLYKSKNIQSEYKKVHNFLQQFIGKGSKNKTEADKELYYEHFDKPVEWSDITKKNDIEHYIENYVYSFYDKLDKNYLSDINDVLTEILHTNYLKQVCKNVEFCSKTNRIKNIKYIKFKNKRLFLKI